MCRKAEWDSRAFSLMQLAISGEIPGTKIARRTRSILFRAFGSPEVDPVLQVGVGVCTRAYINPRGIFMLSSSWLVKTVLT